MCLYIASNQVIYPSIAIDNGLHYTHAFGRHNFCMQALTNNILVHSFCCGNLVCLASQDVIWDQLMNYLCSINIKAWCLPRDCTYLSSFTASFPKGCTFMLLIKTLFTSHTVYPWRCSYMFPLLHLNNFTRHNQFAVTCIYYREIA